MTTWSGDELDAIERAEELAIDRAYEASTRATATAT
jgi:hypothetical protein